MSEIITGYIEDKQIKDSPAGSAKEWRRFAFKVGGKTFSSFDVKMDEFKTGELVTIEYAITGGYNNIKTMSRGMPTQTPQPPQNPLPPPSSSTPMPIPTPAPVLQPPVPTAAPAKTTSYIDRNRETEASIVSQVIIKATVELVCAGKIEAVNLKANTRVLAENYKEIKKQLLE